MSVRVTGTAQRSLEPSAVVWRADAVERDDDPRAAFERCTVRLNELTSRLAALGELSTSAVSVQREWVDEHEHTLEAVGGVRVRCEIARGGEVAQAAMDAGADRLDGPRFMYDDIEAARDELLDDAMADARRKAERLAAAAGRPLGRVKSVKARSDDRWAVAELASSGGPDVRGRDTTVVATVDVVFAFAD